MEKKKKLAVIIGIVLLILVGAAAIFALIHTKKGTDAEEAGGYVMGEENYQQIMDQMESDVREGYFETYMNTEWTFADGTAMTEDAVLGNSPNNAKPIRCEVLLADTEETVFTTGVIPVGAQLPAFKLDTDLDAGTYDAICMVYLLDEMSDGTYKDYSSAGFNVRLIVEN